MTAAELILKKALVASNLDSKEWNTIQAALRNRAFFSSCVAEANILQAMRHRAAEYAARGVDISEARKQMRADLERMHYAPKEGDEGTIKDLFSEARLNVILKHNLDQARGMIQRASGMTPGAFAAFPALEFKRIHRRDSLCGQILLRNFGDQVAIENSVVSWQGNLIQDVISGKRKKAQLGVGYNGRPLPISHNFFKEHLSKHYGKNETHPNSIPLRDSDYELIPAMWHKPDKVSKSGDRDHLEFETLDGYILHLFVSAIKGIRSFYKTKSGRSLQ